MALVLFSVFAVVGVATFMAWIVDAVSTCYSSCSSSFSSLANHFHSILWNISVDIFRLYEVLTAEHIDRPVQMRQVEGA